MKAGDRKENHELFVALRGEECLKICTKSFLAGRKMKPRIPGVTVLESCRPNFAKYFKKSEFGECSMCKPPYDNYAVFVAHVQELKPELELPATVSLYVRSRICSQKHGDQLHECQENRCKNCSFVNYFVKDPSISKEQSRYVNHTTFSEEHGVNFFLILWLNGVSMMI